MSIDTYALPYYTDDYPDPPDNLDFLTLPRSFQARVAARLEAAADRENELIHARQVAREGLETRRDWFDRRGQIAPARVVVDDPRRALGEPEAAYKRRVRAWFDRTPESRNGR